MDKQLLNNLKKGEHLVEIQEYMLQYNVVYKVIVYTCRRKTLFNTNKIDTFEFPFYFKSKTVAEDFLKYWDDLWLAHTTYWAHGKDNHCFGMYTKNNGNDSNVYIMVDDFKFAKKDSNDHKCQLTYDGVWDGKLCKDGRYYIYTGDLFYFTNIFNLENVAQKIDKAPYIFKMVKE